MIVLENDNRPSINCIGDDIGIAGGVGVKTQKDQLASSENNVALSRHEEGRPSVEVKSQKDRLDCSASYVLVSCHLEMLRHSLADDLHLTQVSLPSLSLVNLAAIVDCSIVNSRLLNENAFTLRDMHLSQVSLLHLPFSHYIWLP